MGYLQDIIGGGDYKGVIGHLDELDGLYEQLIGLISIEEIDIDYIPNNTAIGRIEHFLDACDQRITQSELSESYLNVVRLIQNAFYDVFSENEFNFSDELMSLREWLFSIHRPRYLFELLYVHQRMMQLRYVLLMYDAGNGENALVSRYLFESGLQQHGVDQSRYIHLVFRERTYQLMCRRSSWHAQFFLRRRKQILPRIKWVDIQNLPTARTTELFEGVKLAHLAYRDHPKKGMLSTCLNPYKLSLANNVEIEGRFHLDYNLNGYIGTDGNGTIVLGFSGTEEDSRENWKTDVRQYFGYLDPVYVNAAQILDELWRDKSQSDDLKDATVKVYGHSLGGGLMQYSIGRLQVESVEGYGYNSAGLSKCNVKRIGSKDNLNILHLYRPRDIVFKLPFACQLGESVSCDTEEPNIKKAHKMESIRKAINPQFDTIAVIKGEMVG